MPKLKEPRTLEDLAIEALGRNVFRICQKAIDAIGCGRHSDIDRIFSHNFLYADLSSVLSHKVTVYMMSVVRRVISIYDESGNKDVKNIMERVILASVYPQITILDMSNLTRYLQRILASNIHIYKKLQTLILSRFLPTDVLEKLPRGLSSLMSLVNFQMHCMCTDDIIESLGLCCSGTIEYIDVNLSFNVTDESFENLIKCLKLKYLSICNTSMTADAFVQYLQVIQQHKKSDDTATGFLRLGVGSFVTDWDISSRQLNKIAKTCPMLRKLEITRLNGNMETLVILTKIEVLEIKECFSYKCNFNECYFDGFLKLRGSNLISLKLSADSVDLVSIMNHCINIKELIFLDGSIKDISLCNTEITANAFEKLEILELYYEVSPSTIERMLYACVNIRSLCLFTEQEDITDEFISRLLSHNPLQKLKSFSTWYTGLSMKSVNAFLGQCPLLEELKYLMMWEGVTRTEMEILRKRIQDDNLDLRIY